MIAILLDLMWGRMLGKKDYHAGVLVLAVPACALITIIVASLLAGMFEAMMHGQAATPGKTTIRYILSFPWHVLATAGFTTYFRRRANKKRP